MFPKKLLKALLLPFLLLITIVSYSQGRVISGKVTDPRDGSPVAGVNVVARGGAAATQTAADGSYSLTVPAGINFIVFSSVGYTSQEIDISSRTTADVSLVINNTSLGEVVVIGYGSTRKRDLTGAATSITAKDFNKGQVTTPEQLIVGKVAGVQITSNGGAPGAGSSIRIRGGASLSASNDPLIVVDGIPLDNGGVSGSPNPLSLINPNDIESFNILKDASATAIYGSRASNGVILITTKKGRRGKPVFNFNSLVSMSKIGQTTDVLTADEFRSFVNNHPNATQAQKDLLGTASTDWQDEIYRTAFAQDNNLSVSGAAKNMPYRISLGFLNQDGVLKTGNLKRTSAAINLSPQLFNNHLRIDLSLKGSVSRSRFANEGAIGSAVSFDPTQPVYSGNPRYGGYFEWLDASASTGLRQLSPRNPVGLLNQRVDKSEVLRSIGNIQFDYKFHFLPDLRANLNLGYDVSRGTGTIVVNDSAAASYRRNPNGSGGVNNHYSQYRDNATVEFYLNYAKNLKNIDSRLDVVAGYGYYDFITTNLNSADYNFNGDIMPNTEPKFVIDKPQYTLISYYGRLNYTFRNKYILTATLRTDGSSRFNPDERWGLFPSAALAWRVKDEDFMRSSNTFSDLKLRLGYGVTGQQDGIPYFDYISFYNLSGNTAQYQLGNTFYNMYRPGGYFYARKWEETSTLNAAVDFAILDNRVSGSVDVYYKKTTNLLNEIAQPAGTNFTNRIVANVGDMENRGVEVTVNTTPVRRADLTWDFNFVFTYNKNKITKLTVVDDPKFPGNIFGGISGGVDNQVLINSVNFQRGSFYVYKQVYTADGKPVENVFADLNKDGTINADDRYRFKGVDPNYLLGVNSNVNFRKWNAGFVMRANLNNYVYNNVFSNTGVSRNILNPLGYLNNGSANVLETNFTGSGDKYILSDYFVENASFLRMDNIYLGYDFGSVLQNAARLRVNANVQNVFVVTKYKGLDPEVSGGIDNNFYPRPRIFSLGLNLEF